MPVRRGRGLSGRQEEPRRPAARQPDFPGRRPAANGHRLRLGSSDAVGDSELCAAAPPTVTRFPTVTVVILPFDSKNCRG